MAMVVYRGARAPSGRRQARRAGGQAGFSLLEILVAFAVLAVSLGVMLRIFSAGTRAAVASEEYSLAMIVAESQLARVGLEEALTEGETEGKTADGYRWRTSVSPYEEEEPQDYTRAGVKPYRVEVAVRWGEGSKPRSLTLQTLRLGAEQP
jgi:general secretion pathway protein I